MKSVLWVTDPWETLDHPNDTSLRLMQESLKRHKKGDSTYWCDLRSIRLEGGKVLLTAQKLVSMTEDRAASGVVLGKIEMLSPTRFSVLHYRTDPPVDAHYLHPLQLLTVATQKTRSKILNPPLVLFSMSEKTGFGLPTRWLPKTLLSSEKDRLFEFGKRLGKTVAKPPNQAQSKGVELLSWESREHEAHSLAVLKSLTADFQEPVILQEFLEAVYEGEKRFWFSGGKLIACALKRPLSGDFRVQVDLGSRIESTKPNRKELQLARALSVFLKKNGIQLAAVDIIDGKITDLNFTSPGLLVQMEKVTGKNLAADVLKWLK